MSVSGLHSIRNSRAYASIFEDMRIILQHFSYVGHCRSIADGLNRYAVACPIPFA
jgi:hypothetical protein